MPKSIRINQTRLALELVHRFSVVSVTELIGFPSPSRTQNRSTRMVALTHSLSFAFSLNRAHQDGHAFALLKGTHVSQQEHFVRFPYQDQRRPNFTTSSLPRSKPRKGLPACCYYSLPIGRHCACVVGTFRMPANPSSAQLKSINAAIRPPAHTMPGPGATVRAMRTCSIALIGRTMEPINESVSMGVRVCGGQITRFNHHSGPTGTGVLCEGVCVIQSIRRTFALQCVLQGAGKTQAVTKTCNHEPDPVLHSIFKRFKSLRNDR